MAAGFLAFGFNLWLPNNSSAACVDYIQSQTIAAAYEGDTTPTVHTMDTCGGDDISYQIPIATTITFDGVQYDQVYATTNSVITFGRADGTYWDYPQTPSISLYSMDWVSGWYNAPDTLNISYSEGGFQLDLEVIPFGQWNAPTPSNINIIVAITNTGNISVAYSYQGPEYSNLRTGVRLHDGSIISLEAWGATQIQPGSPTPTLQAEPISGSVTDPTPSPSPSITPPTAEEIQTRVIATTQLATEISNLNLLIANINGDPTPTIEPTPEPTQTTDPDIIVVEPEIITPEGPRFPNGTDEQNQPTDPTPTPTTTPEPVVTPESSPKPSSQQTDKSKDPVIQPTVNPSSNQDIKTYINSSTMGISEDEAKMLVGLAAENKNIATAIQQFDIRAEENETGILPYTLADATTEVQAEEFLKDPLGSIINVDVKELLSNFSELGSDMTQDQREKAQEVIIPVVLVSNIVSTMIAKRR